MHSFASDDRVETQFAELTKMFLRTSETLSDSQLQLQQQVAALQLQVELLTLANSSSPSGPYAATDNVLVRIPHEYTTSTNGTSITYEDIDARIHKMILTMKQEIESEVVAKVLVACNKNASEKAEKSVELQNPSHEPERVNNAMEPSDEQLELQRNKTQFTEGETQPFQPEYSFRESVWDLAVFVGFKEIGPFGSLLTSTLFLLNVLLQVGFCIVVFLNFTKNDFDKDTIAGLNFFRLHTSHDAKYADPLSAYTLARGICNENKEFNWRKHRYLYATSQLNTKDIVDSYIGDKGSALDSAFNARTMCMMALFCWILSAMQEVRSIIHFFGAMMSIPRDMHTKLYRSDCRTEVRWLAISYPRFAFCCVIVFLRISCCFYLLYCGCVWLSYTVEAKELLLNAVALSFVINVDELLFVAAVPLSSKRMIEIIQPVRENERIWVHIGGVDIFSLVVLVLLVTITAFFTIFFVEAMMENMREARDTLCVGDLDFSYSIDKIGLAWYQRWTRKKSDPFLHGMDKAATRSKQQLIDKATPYLANPVVRAYGSGPMQIAQKTFAELVNFANRECLDITHSQAHPGWQYNNFLDIFLTAHDMTDISSNCASACPSLAKFSTFKEGKYVRFVCSKSCGCRRPDSVIPSRSADYGCSDHCFATGEYRTNLQAMSCTDPPLSSLQNSDFWPNWVAYMNSTFQSYDNTFGPTWALAMNISGCAFLGGISHPHRLALCEGYDPSVNMRPFAPICPVMCECNTTKPGSACNPLCEVNMTR